MAFDQYAWKGVYILAIMWSLAALVFFTGPGRPTNRLLGATLFFEGLGAAAFRFFPPSVSPTAANALDTLGYISINLAFVLYPLLFGLTIPSPLMAPWRLPTVRRALYGLAAVGFVAAVLFKPFFAANNAEITLVLSILLLYGLAGAVDAFRRAPKGSAERTAMRFYLLAFAARDILGAAVLLYFATVDIWGMETTLSLSLSLAVTVTIYGPLLAYALLRHQLFDIDLRIKMGLQRGTLGGVFLATFLVVAKLAESAADRYLGGQSWIAGAVAAGLLLFALSPLQRISEQLADRAMPGVKNEPEYVRFKQLEVYRAAAESVLVDAAVTRAERGFLERLRTRFSIDGALAEAIEQEVRDRRGPLMARTASVNRKVLGSRLK